MEINALLTIFREEFTLLIRLNKRKMPESIREKAAFICDMDGVIYHGDKLLPYVKEFVDWLNVNNKKYLFLTNSSERAPRELAQKLTRMGLDVSESHFYTSALATASYLASQSPGGSVFVIGEPGLVNALYNAGFSMNNYNPDYVVFGETRSLNYEMIEHATRLVINGAKLIGTNSDLTGPSEKGIIPACRALISPIEMASGRQAYYIGKPNPLIMRHALKSLDIHRIEAALIGDRMDTDIVAGIESEIDTILVLSGVSDEETVKQFPYQPMYICKSVGSVIGLDD
jgi:NagD protein